MRRSGGTRMQFVVVAALPAAGVVSGLLGLHLFRTYPSKRPAIGRTHPPNTHTTGLTPQGLRPRTHANVLRPATIRQYSLV
jgi:hypothetical protein